MRKFLFGLIAVLFICINNAMSTLSIFEDHKLQVYSPMKVGVKDLLFEVRIDGLIENIKRTTSITKIDDLYVRFYWVFPGEYRMEVEGIPKGFELIRNNIKAQVKPYVDLIFSEDFIRQFERSPFVKDPKEKNTFIKKNNPGETSDVKISFNENGIMNKIESRSPMSVVLTNFEFKQRSWSDGKYILASVEIQEKASGLVSSRIISVERDVYSGVGLPKSIVVDENVKQADKEISKNQIKIFFSNYHVNEGKAEKFLKQN